jgi:ABC-type molybdate transport system substrate-binding protein
MIRAREVYARLVMTALAIGALMNSASGADDVVRLYSAGSLRSTLTETAAAFEKETTIRVQAKFGASGTLKDEIVRGAPVDVFTSAPTWSIRRRSLQPSAADR